MGTYKRPRFQRRRGGDSFGHVHGNAATSGGPLHPIFGGDDSHRGKPDYHTAALCKQVRRALTLALAGECGDPVLQGLIVEEVLPAPNAGRLLVRVLVRVAPAALSLEAAPPAAEGGIIADVLQRLAGVHKLLRLRVGESIARKRTPELAFEVIPLGQPASSAPDAGTGGAP